MWPMRSCLIFYQRNILIFDTVWKLHIIVPQYTLYILYLTSYILQAKRMLKEANFLEGKESAEKVQ